MAAGSAEKESLLAKLLKGITAGSAQRPRVTLWLVLVLSCISIGATVTYVRFRTERSDLVDSEHPVQQAWAEYKQYFGEASDIIVVVEADSPAAIRGIMDDVADRLQREPALFAKVLHRVEAGKLQAKAMQFLTEQELIDARRQVQSYSPILKGNRWDRIELDSYASILDTEINKRLSSGENPSAVLRQTRLLTASMTRFYNHMANNFQVDQTTFRPPWPDTVRVDQYVSSQSDFCSTANTLTKPRVPASFIR